MKSKIRQEYENSVIEHLEFQLRRTQFGASIFKYFFIFITAIFIYVAYDMPQIPTWVLMVSDILGALLWLEQEFNIERIKTEIRVHKELWGLD